MKEVCHLFPPCLKTPEVKHPSGQSLLLPGQAARAPAQHSNTLWAVGSVCHMNAKSYQGVSLRMGLTIWTETQISRSLRERGVAVTEHSTKGRQARLMATTQAPFLRSPLVRNLTPLTSSSTDIADSTPERGQGPNELVWVSQSGHPWASSGPNLSIWLQLAVRNGQKRPCADVAASRNALVLVRGIWGRKLTSPSNP